MANVENQILNQNAPKSPIKEISISLPKEYASILEDLTSKIKAAQSRAMVAVNRELIEVYREIGKTIHEQQEGAKWGASVVEQLARD
ncbi:MAG: hypothetical protein K2X08_05830, partial [Chlamydiales bacterium]|nr:hypothetical protein [Chlamydiales bacterium]